MEASREHDCLYVTLVHKDELHTRGQPRPTLLIYKARESSPLFQFCFS